MIFPCVGHSAHHCAALPLGLQYHYRVRDAGQAAAPRDPQAVRRVWQRQCWIPRTVRHPGEEGRGLGVVEWQWSAWSLSSAWEYFCPECVDFTLDGLRSDTHIKASVKKRLTRKA